MKWEMKEIFTRQFKEEENSLIKEVFITQEFCVDESNPISIKKMCLVNVK